MNMGSGCGDMVDFRTDSLVFDYESDEDEYYDESVLPSVDPITKQPIFDAVRNKFCNHVFDQQSVLEYMLENPDAK
jgi:SUMO ligase MMS21 Smc5/6 complex component